MGFNKKVLSKAVSELGKAKAPAKPRDIITDPAGQWKYPGQKTRIPGSSITMQGVNYPVWAQPNVGPGAIMYPEENRNFKGASYVDETPIGRKGGTLKSKRYSSNISATNKLFTKNKLFQNKKSKIFDPNAKFKSGGSKLGPINLNPNPLSHYELNYGFNLPTKQEGGENEDEYMDLTDEEIKAYRDGGYVVEEEPEYEIGGYVQHELVKAQNGKTVKTFNRDIRDQDAQSNTGWSSAPVEKKKVQPTVKQKQVQKSFDKNFKVTDKSKYEKTEDKIASEQQKLKDWGKEKGIPITNADLENVANQQWSFAGVDQQDRPGPDMMQATPEQSNSSRAWEYMTNPMTAAEYAISGGGAENMPHNINEMRMAGFDPGVIQGRNLVGNTLNSSLNLLDAGDKVARNAYRGNYGDAALEALRFAPGSGLLDDAVRLGIKPGTKYLSKTLGKFNAKKLPGSPNSAPVQSGMLNPFAIADQLIPKISPYKFATIGMPVEGLGYMSGSPLNLLSFYGKKMGAEGQAFRKFGNSMADVIKTKTLSPAGGSKFRMGKDQIVSEGNWAASGKFDENYPGVFGAKFDPKAPGTNLDYHSIKNRNGVLVTDKAGNKMPAIPLDDEGMEFFRRMPFSHRYTSVDKEKLMNDKFQWATQGGYLQSLLEKYGVGLGVATGAGAIMGSDKPLQTYNKYTIDPLIKVAQPYLNNINNFSKDLKNTYENNIRRKEYRQGGIIEEEWEDELSGDEIEKLRRAGYVVEELD